MSQQPDTLLIVDDDPEVRTLLREQVFSAKEYRVIEAKDGPDALLRLKDQPPDLVLLDLVMPGLTGRDMLVALKSQGYNGPLIVMADRENKTSAVEAFRLGATDVVTKPIREAEALAVVERGLVEVRLRRQRNILHNQLKTANEGLETRIQELTTLYTIGQTVTEMRQLEALFDHILEGATRVTGADHALLLLRDDKSGELILRAGKNLPMALADRMGEPRKDQLASLVMTSREALAVSGDSLRRFDLAKDLHAVAYVPLSVQKTAVGVLAVGNHHNKKSFDENHGRLLKILADYAAIAIMNTRLYNMIEQRGREMENATQQLRERDAQRGRQLQIVLSNLQQPLGALDREIYRIVKGEFGKLPADAVKHLARVGQEIKKLSRRVEAAKQAPPKS